MATITKILIRFVFFIFVCFRPMSCMSNVASIAGLSILDCLVVSSYVSYFHRYECTNIREKRTVVKTSIPIFKIIIFQFVLICHYSDIKNMHESLCCLSSPGFVSLKTRPEVRSMLYKFRLEFIIYLRSIWLFLRALRSVRWFSQSIVVRIIIFYYRILLGR